ncbi:hypothetical protein [Xanthocytophaga flava]|uniref:hypothetical protein n=1 Tax=Xanthocytophaga flava TaxID=3048013 RepID=UPI0028D8CA08|nr:hypothetical protein [Xanthocytophaga flavus]MDJ1472449.1 hypothetical protein [Xanthocytophaga flavus]
MGYIRNDGRNSIIIRRGIRVTASRPYDIGLPQTLFAGNRAHTWVRPYIGSEKYLCVGW